MKTLGYRILLIVVALTALGTLFAMVGGFVSAVATGWVQAALHAGLVVVFALSIVGLWKEFDRMDEAAEESQKT